MSPTGLQVSPGLWGGGLRLHAHTAPADLKFGHAARPTRLSIPANALPRDYYVLLSAAADAQPLRVSPGTIDTANKNLAKAQSAYTAPVNGQFWEFLVSDASSRRIGENLALDATVTVTFPDADGNGVVDGTSPPVRAETLSLWWLDEIHTLWVRIPGSRVNKETHEVSAPVRQLSVFAVMGAPSYEVGESFAFPNPWRPHGPEAGTGAGQSGTEADGITFSNLPSMGSIKIYTLSGELVRKLDHTDGTQQQKWDGRSAAGGAVATGTYIYVIESDGARKTGKLVIVR